jgi:hypothetical protein
MSMDIYISGPISGTDNYELKFKRAVEFLHKEKKWPLNKIHNPVEIVKKELSEIKREDREACMAAVVPVLAECGYVYFLRGWDMSKGARIEMQIALAMNKRIRMEG